MFRKRFRRGLGWGTAVFGVFYVCCTTWFCLALPLLYRAAWIHALTILPTAVVLALVGRLRWGLPVLLGAILAPAFSLLFAPAIGTPATLQSLFAALFAVPGAAVGMGAACDD